jgi:hypothetical protein
MFKSWKGHISTPLLQINFQFDPSNIPQWISITKIYDKNNGSFITLKEKLQGRDWLGNSQYKKDPIKKYSLFRIQSIIKDR